MKTLPAVSGRTLHLLILAVCLFTTIVPRLGGSSVFESMSDHEIDEFLLD